MFSWIVIVLAQLTESTMLVFGLTGTELKSLIYNSRGEDANHYTTHQRQVKEVYYKIDDETAY